MRIVIPDKIRVYLSKKYLDWAIKIPKFGTIFIPEAQEIRDHLIHISEDEYLRSRPPKEMKLEFISFRLIEIFHIEEFNTLQKGIIKLFPNLRSDYRNRNFLADFRRFASSISVGGTKNIGIIYRHIKTRRFSSISITQIRSLPEEVKYIRVSIQKIFPSIIVLVLDVNLGEKATDHLNELQKKHYFPRIRLTELLPWRKKYWAFSMESPEMVKKYQIISWFENLRARIEKCIKPYLKGYFLKKNNKIGSQLPALEIFGIKGELNSLDEFKILKDKSRHWWKSLGFNFYLDVFSNGKILFTYPETDRYFANSAYRLVVLWKLFISSFDPKSFSGERRAALFKTKFFLDAITPYISIIMLSKVMKKNIENLRQKVFVKMKDGLISRSNLKSLIKLNNTVMRESVLLDRVSMEFSQEKDFFQLEMESYMDFIRIDDDRKGEYLRGALFQNTNYKIKRLKKYFLIIENSLSKYLALSNMRSMFVLQRRIMVLTFILLLATFFGLAIKRADIKELIIGIANFVSGVISRIKIH